MRVWDLNRGIATDVLRGHNHVISSVVAHPDGNRVLSASYDQIIRVWDLRTGTARQVL